LSKKRVVVTGLGLLTSLGEDVKSTWEQIKAGKSGITKISHFDASEYPVTFSGSLKDFDTEPFVSKRDARRMDPFIQYGIVTGCQAIDDSGLEINEENATRIGAAIGSGIGGLGTIENNYAQILKSGPRKVSPFFVPGSIINMIAGNLSIKYGFKGPNISITTACTTAVHNIGVAARLIQTGDADVMIAGGSEMATTPLGVAGFAAARALSTRNDAPQEASRPWDRDRDGFVLGDGAGMMVLEEYEHAKARGAKIYAELSGFGMSGDAYHMTSPPDNGQGAFEAMQNAIKDGGINPEDVDYINAHGTSTKVGDIAETIAVKRLLGDHASKVMMSSTKSMTGHLLGAAGAIEMVFSVLSLCEQVVPPTINLENPEEGCDLDYVPGSAREATVNTVLCNSFGFGGTNGSIALKKV
jgi:3-oxoacyl-[acyl-carrier-protein] synthase II